VGTISLRSLLDEAAARLRAVSEAPELDARRIVERASGHDASELRFELDRPVTRREMAYYDRMVERRAAGEPLQYVLGSWAFRTLDLFLDRRVLIPRPETEVVAGVALDELDRSLATAGRDPRTTPPVVVDLGTGSGAIALSVAVERVHAQVWATDASEDALDIARANLAGIGRHASRVQLAPGDWFDALPGHLAGRVDLVVSNPPYVAASEELPSVVRDWEPSLALVPGPTGLEAYERIVPEARRWLAPGGVVVLEIGAEQGPALRSLAAAAGYASAVVLPDLAGRDRAVVLRP
jgi:release factor glutamine methyltransferase